MKKLTLAAVAAVAVGTAMAGASVTLGTPRQRYPWNGKMDIPYALTGTDAAKTYQLVTSLTVGGVTKAVMNELGAVADGGYTNTVDCAALFGTAVARETATVNLAVLTYGKPVIAITPVSKIWGPFLIINLTPNANGGMPVEVALTDESYADATVLELDLGHNGAYVVQLKKDGTTEAWQQADTEDVRKEPDGTVTLTVPATEKQGFMILKSKSAK